MTSNNDKFDKQVISFRADTQIRKMLNVLSKYFKNRTEVITFALYYMFKSNRKSLQKALQARKFIAKQNMNLFADVHNFIESDNEFTSALNHIGNNVNQIAKRINSISKKQKIDALNRDDRKSINGTRKYIEGYSHEIILNENRIFDELHRVLKILNKKDVNQKRMMRLLNKGGKVHV